jgi:hypothetical protein
MAAKTYFLAPSFDYVPDRYIDLGRIIADPTDPGTSLNPDSPKPPPSSVQTYIEKDYEKAIEQRGKVKVGIWARFAGQFGIGDISVNTNSVKNDVYKFQELETRLFQPTDEYIEEALQYPQVVRFAAKSGYRRPLFMITGVKIARGANISKEMVREHGLSAKVGIDGTPGGVPVDLAVGGEASELLREKEKFDAPSDFVFAFRLRKIFYEKGSVQHREFTKGALFGLNDGEDNDDGELAIEVLGPANRDTVAEDFKNDPELKKGALRSLDAVDDDGIECQTVLIVK